MSVKSLPVLILILLAFKFALVNCVSFDLEHDALAKPSMPSPTVPPSTAWYPAVCLLVAAISKEELEEEFLDFAAFKITLSFARY